MTNVAEVESGAAKLACEQALLFQRAKRAAQERVSERESREGARFLSRVYFSRYPPNGELARRLQQNSSVTIQQGHPTTIFGKISVRKTIWDLEFSEHLL